MIKLFPPSHSRFSRLRLLASAVFVMVFISQCQSQLRPPQVAITDQDTVGYGFIRQDENVITNRAYLDPLFQKLYLQRTKGGQKINIVQIGDSHVLGNFETREIRQRIQREFGDAGRGFIFPYKIAGSNGPSDYLVEGTGKWNGSNCQRDLSESTPYGVAGFALVSANPNAALTFRLRDTATSETKLFTKVTVFQRKTAKEFDVVVKDDVSNQEAMLIIDDEYMHSYFFDRPVGQVTIAAQKGTSQQKEITLDGVSIENELAGVIYHSIGVNGSKFQDFARARYFARQVAELSPDLIILSFGTNESQGKTDRNYMYKSMENLVNQLLEHSPNALIMLTTPADSYLRGKGFNPNLVVMCDVIRDFAKDKGYALWDRHNFTGGENSAEAWKTRGLMSSDSVHYSKLGYAVQGKLLYQAFIKAYNEHVLNMRN